MRNISLRLWRNAMAARSVHNARMPKVMRSYGGWILIGCLVTALGWVLLARFELARLREAFETDARIAHRLLSQRVVQHDAVLATLALLQPTSDPSISATPEQRLSSVYPQIMGVIRRDPGQAWPDEQLRAAEVLSQAVGRPALADADFSGGRYRLVLAAQPTSFAVLMDLRSVVPWSEWPMAPETSPVRLTLDHDGQSFVVQPGRLSERGWRFEFHKHLAAQSQPFDVAAVRQVGWGELPWLWMAAWAAAVAGVLYGLLALQRQREERRRAEELLRLGQVARLNTLGELAAGMAHELNQPLTAMLANTQAAARLLDEEPPEIGIARDAMKQAGEQAARASAVVARMRRAVERPDLSAQVQAVSLHDAVRTALYLLEPEFRRCEVEPLVEAPATSPMVLAEPVALEQVIHNLLMNALQALEQVPAMERHLTINLSAQGAQGVLTVTDSGPGIAPEVLPRIFEPFFTTRDGGLGLGLSLCETLAGSMGGTLSAAHNSPRGAAFILSLPLASL
jgi:signal transduction histidine kinase